MSLRCSRFHPYGGRGNGRNDSNGRYNGGNSGASWAGDAWATGDDNGGRDSWANSTARSDTAQENSWDTPATASATREDRSASAGGEDDWSTHAATTSEPKQSTESSSNSNWDANANSGNENLSTPTQSKPPEPAAPSEEESWN